LNNSLCEYCFKVLEKEIDDDRYIYQCPDIKCLFWENGHNENVDRIAEGIKSNLDECGYLKAIEVKAALTKVLESYNIRVMQISKLRDDQRGL
jgi:hypothetical protein